MNLRFLKKNVLIWAVIFLSLNRHDDNDVILAIKNHGDDDLIIYDDDDVSMAEYRS